MSLSATERTKTVEQAFAELERIVRELDTDYARAIQGEVKSVAGNWLAGLRSSIAALRGEQDTLHQPADPRAQDGRRDPDEANPWSQMSRRIGP